MSLLINITNSMEMNLSKLETVEDRGAWHAAVHGIAKSQVQLSDLAETEKWSCFTSPLLTSHSNHKAEMGTNLFVHTFLLPTNDP